MQPLLINSKKRRHLNLIIMSLIFLTGLIGTAKAGDVADRDILGFSPDGVYFAFEEYGVQDGSGFPYSNIYISQTRNNSWIKNSPIRVLVEDEAKPVDDAREIALAQAKPLLDKLKITKRGSVLASNPATEIDRDPLNVTVAPGPQPFLKNHSLTFKLNAEKIETKRCADYGEESQMGYALSVQRKGEKVKELHKDKRIPTSRGCPKSYAISDIVRYEPEGDTKESVYIVILQVFSYGFEGDDGRYLANSSWMPNFHATN